MELATALIWTLRIVLPIILFCIYFKLQSPKEEVYPGPKNNVVSRGKLLARRKTVPASKPKELETIALKDQTDAPELFVQNERRSIRGGDRRGSGGGERGAPRERREKRDGGPGKEKRDKTREIPVEEAEAAPKPAASKEAAKVATSAPREAPSPTQDKMHLESLLNYVAFNKNVQQRTFLPDDDAAPPPPPPKPPPAKEPVGAKDNTESANQEAQLVLRGAINYKRSDVAKDIFEQLTKKQIEISEKTFTLMIEACVLARDLKTASNFLMQMETSGFTPDGDLLDKVMDLYSQQKSQKEIEKPDAAFEYMYGGMAANTMPVMSSGIVGNINMMNNATDDGGRAKLRTDAPLFVPSFGVAPVDVPQVAEAAPPPPAADEIVPQRTKLVAAAKPFEPQFNVTFFPDTYTWSFEEKWEDGGEDDGSKGKGKNSKGKSGGKSKGKGGKTDDAAHSPEKAKDKKDAKDGKKGSKAWKPKEAAS